MTTEDVQESKFLHEVSSRILKDVLSLMDSRPGGHDSIKDFFQLVRGLWNKRLSSPLQLPGLVAAATFALHAAIGNAYPEIAGNKHREEQVAELVVQLDDLYNNLESELRAPDNSVAFAYRLTAQQSTTRI